MNAWVWQPTNSSGHTVTHPYWLWLLGHQVSPLISLIAHQGSRRGHDKLMPASCFFLGSREACIPWYVYQADNQWPQFVYCSTTSNVPVLLWCSVWLVSMLLWDPQLTQVCSLLQRWDMVTLAWQSTITTIKKVKWCFSSRLMWFGLIAWSDALSFLAWPIPTGDTHHVNFVNITKGEGSMVHLSTFTYFQVVPGSSECWTSDRRVA